MLKFCLVIDTERFVSFTQGNPRWGLWGRLKGRINSLLKNYRYNYNGVNVVYNALIKNKFPATLMLVGSLFKPKKDAPRFIEWGYHTYAHSPLTLVSDERVKEEVKNSYKVKSFSPPLWMVHDIKNPDRVFKEIQKQGYQKVIYRGIDNGLLHDHHFAVTKPVKKGKLDLIHVSNCFEGNSSHAHMMAVFEDIVKNLDKNAVYCLSTHDFTHKNNTNLLKVINLVKTLEKEGKIKVVNVKDA